MRTRILTLAFLSLSSGLSHASIHDWKQSRDAFVGSSEPRCLIPPGMSTCTASINYSATEDACVYVRKGNSTQLAQCGKSGSFQASYIDKVGIDFELVLTSTGQAVAGTFVQGETTPIFMNDPVKGVALEVLDGSNRYNVVSMMYRLAFGDGACNDVNISTDGETDALLASTLSLLAESGVTWIKIPLNYTQMLNHIRSNFDSSGLRCTYLAEDVEGMMSTKMLQALNTLLGTIKSYGFKIQLEFSGSSSLEDPLPPDQWVESVLRGVPAWAMDLISLADGVTTQDLPQVEYLYSLFKQSNTSKFRNLNYTFTPAPLQSISDIEKIASSVERHAMPVMPLSIGPVSTEAPGPELLNVTDIAEAYYALKLYQPIWINEVSYRWYSQGVSDQYDIVDVGPAEVPSFDSQYHFLQDFTSAYLEFSGSEQQHLFLRQLPVFFNGAGIDAYADDSFAPKYEIWENGSQSLFLEYSETNQLQVTPNWQVIADSFNTSLNF
tara:strand:+ start:6524 stop:8005 length:1482 start_codon:yes stop_codon:yes gene_type:complete